MAEPGRSAWQDVDLRALPSGFRFPDQRILLDRETIAAYLAAVGDEAPMYRDQNAVVPPLAIAALSMRGITELLPAHPGTLHASQRLIVHRAVAVGDAIDAALTVHGRSERRGFVLLSLQLQISPLAMQAAGNGPALEGTIVLLVPLGRRSANDA